MTKEDQREVYAALCHAMQSGVAAKMGIPTNESRETDPKHLRVGVNSAMCDMSGLVRLLIRKGIITEEEYFAVIVESMQEEVERYERYLTQAFGRDVKLH